MGRAIDQDNRLDDHERRIKLVEDALEELVQTKVHHVDLHESTREILTEETEVKPDETFEKPKKKRKVKEKAESA